MLIMKYLMLVLALAACNAKSTNSAVSSSQAASASGAPSSQIVPPQYDAAGKLIKVTKSDEEWRKELNDLEYNVLREEGTERAGSGDLVNNHADGTYICRGCGLPLFDSATKFESGTGWPSFYQPLKPDYVAVGKDDSYGMSRDEVECARCGGHLGHVFDDGPPPTGLRYCMNAVSLDFVAR